MAMIFNRISRKMLNPVFSEYLLFFIIILSLPYYTKDKIAIKLIKIVFSTAFFYMIFFRLSMVSLKNIIKDLSFDEVLIAIICVIAIITGFLHNGDLFKGIDRPLMFLLSYLGISSYAKTASISEKTFVKILILYAILIFTHTLIEFIISSPLLFNYLTSKLVYRDYLLNSWKFLYPNYNYFARNPMIGMMASLSLCFYYYLNKGDKKISLGMFFLSVFFGLIVLMTFSRTSIFGTVAYAAILSFYFIITYSNNIKERLNFKNILCIGLILLISLWFLLHFNFIHEVILKTQNQGSTYRFGLWSEFLKREISIFPSWDFFIGHGFKQRNSIFYPIWSGVSGRHVHNNFLFIWYNYGFISMVLFIIVLLKIWISSLKIIDKIWFVYFIPLSYVCVIFFECVLTNHNLRFEVIFFFIFLILPYNMYLQNKNSMKKEIS